tara:strand:- start:1171 stop:2712 length:1542 start_codon:yes stop_codon:yes gene_type:complete
MPKERRRRYTNYSRPQSYLDPLRPGERVAPRANISRTLLEEVRFAGEELQESRDEINAFKSAQEKRKFDLQEKILKTKSIEKDNPMNTLTPQLNAMVNDVQKAYLDGFKSGDMSLAEDKERSVNRAVDTILGVTAALDTESKKIQDMSSEEAEKLILHSQFAGDDGMVTPEDRKKYLDLLKDPSKLGYRYENGDWVIQLKTDDGYVDLFNGTEYKNAYEKDGFSLIKLADNYDEEIKNLDAEVSQGLDALKTKNIETKIASGKETTEELIDYSKAVNTYRDRLENNLSLDALINESNYQRFVPKNQRSELDKYMEFSDDPNSASYKKTREELINYMVSQRYPSSEVVARTVIKPEDKKDSSGKEVEKPKHTKEINKLLDSKSLLSNVVGQKELDAVAIKDLDAYAKTNIGKEVIREQRLKSVKEYLLNLRDVVTGESLIKKGIDKKAEPNDLYQAFTTRFGTTYEPIDIEGDFPDSVFEDPDMLERLLQSYFQPTEKSATSTQGFVGQSRAKK